MFNRFLLVVQLVLLSGGELLAQSPDIIQYQRKDGIFTNGANLHLMQDSRGFIWGCSAMGVFKFDGTHFSKFDTENGLPNIGPVQTVEAPDGTIWVLNYNGQLAFYRDGCFHHYPLTDSVQKLLVGGNNWHFSINEKGRFYIGTVRDGLWEFDTTTKTLTQKIVQGHVRKGLCIWFRKGGVPVAFGLTEHAWKLADSLHFINDQLTPVKSIAYDFGRQTQEFRPYLAQNSEGLTALIFGRNVIELSERNGVENALHSPEFLLSLAYSDNTWLIGTRGGGIKRLKTKSLSPVSPLVLHGRDILSVINDYDGGIWATVRSEGLAYIPSPDVLRFTTSNSHIPADNIKTITTADSCLFVTTGENGVFQFTPQSSKLLYWKGRKNPSMQARFGTIFFNPSNHELYLTYDNHIAHFIQGSFEKIQFTGLSSPDIPITSFIDVQEMGTWALGHYSGFRFVKDEIVETLPQRNDRFMQGVLTPHGLFLSGFKGLYLYRDSQLTYLGDNDPVFRSGIASLCFYQDALWVSHPVEGLCIYGNGKLIPVEATKGLGMVRNLTSESDTLWAHDLDHLIKIFYNSNDSISVIQYRINFDNNARIRNFVIQGRRFYFSTSNGIMSIDRGHLQVPSAPQTSFTSIAIDDVDTALLPHYTLGYHQNLLQIGFHGMDFRSQNITYKYRMKGVDKRWKYTSDNKLQYTELRPGNYVFDVYSQLPEGTLSKTPASVAFTIKPPIWETWWFRIMAIVFGMMLLLGVFKWRIRGLERKRKIDLRLHELERKALRSQMNPHFIFNVLGAIQGYVSESDTHSSEIYLAKFARLIRLILENSRKTYVLLQAELDMLKNYLDMEKMRFRHKFEYHFEIGPEVDPEVIEVPSMLIQPYIENAVLHGMSPLEGAGKIILKVERTNDTLVCTIDDNGSGMRAKANDRSAHRSFGMLITSERLKLLSDQSFQNFKVDVRDKALQGGHGTRVILQIPINTTQ